MKQTRGLRWNAFLGVVGGLAAVAAMGSAPIAVGADDGLAPARVLTDAQKARLATKAPKTAAEARYLEMSPMGAVAAGVVPVGLLSERPDIPSGRVATGVQVTQPSVSTLSKFRPMAIGGTDQIVHATPAYAGQAETSIASNPAGTVLVAGFNDARGFNLTAGATGLSLSGVVRSTDGGSTWTDVKVGPVLAAPFFDGTALPVLPTGGAGKAVFGDPEVKWSPTLNSGAGGFVYASIYCSNYTTACAASSQGLSIHTSSADGGTWSAPILVTPSFITNAAADKEFIDVDQATGRILVTWTNFPTAGGSEIRATTSTDAGATWSPSVLIETNAVGGGVQASIPRFGTGTNAYCTWRTSDSLGNRNIHFAKSTDDGLTWAVPLVLTTDYSPEDQILGVDRINTSPSLAVDLTAGNPTSGNIYVVYQANNTLGQGDIAFQRSTDGGATFSSRILIDSNPGADRAQFYPWVTVDQTTRRVHAVWYDQDSFATGDMTQQMHTYSTDGGVTWSRPVPVVDRPFHAGYGNDTSQPNVGDYNQNVSINGVHHATFAATSVAPRFDEGQCANPPGCGSMYTPDTYYDRSPDSTSIAALRLDEDAVVFTESNCGGVGTNGTLDPLEIGNFTFPLKNYALNPNNSPITYTGVSATLSTTTPNVGIANPVQAYGSIVPGSTATNATAFQVWLQPGFVAGTYVDLVLDVTTTQGESVQLLYRLATGSPGTTTVLLNENFESIATPALPSGWSVLHGGGTTTTPWVTDPTYTGSKCAFHTNSGTTGTKFERLISPVVVVPATTPGFVEVEFDLVYRLEDDTTHAVQAWDGLTVRVTDNTAGATLRSVLAEAYAEKLKTGTANHFPKHLPRSSSTSYFQDMSVWSGDSVGTKHVYMKLPGTGTAGKSIQLRFEYTEDSSGACTDNGYAAPCGVGVDNIVVRHVVSADAHCVSAPVELVNFSIE